MRFMMLLKADKNTEAGVLPTAHEFETMETALVARRLVDSLVTNAPPRDRDVESERARARAYERFGRPGEGG